MKNIFVHALTMLIFSNSTNFVKVNNLRLKVMILKSPTVLKDFLRQKKIIPQNVPFAAQVKDFFIL